jgi:hypothetical protein
MSGTLSFPNTFPPNCPPPDAEDASGIVYRSVNCDPPQAEDFRTYAELNKRILDPKKVCQSHSVSVLRSEAEARHHLAVSPYVKFLAVAELMPTHGKIKATKSRQLDSHTSWWYYQGVERHTIFKVILCGLQPES